MAYTVREKRRAYTRRKYCGFIRLGPEDAKFLETAHQDAVTKKLHRVPVQSRLECLEGDLEKVGVSCMGTGTGQTRTICISRTSS